jgi:hypothetical protein
MKVKKLLQILNKKCPVCNEVLTNLYGQWCCAKDGTESWYHIITDNSYGNINVFSIEYDNYKLIYHEFDKDVSFLVYSTKINNERVPGYQMKLLLKLNMNNIDIEQFLKHKDMEKQIEKLLILC